MRRLLLNCKKDLATFCKWSREWLMLFNVDRCKILHLGHGNKIVSYTTKLQVEARYRIQAWHWILAGSQRNL
jgi:hypothetical protein